MDVQTDGGANRWNFRQMVVQTCGVSDRRKATLMVGYTDGGPQG